MVIIGADHAGFELKNSIINFLKEKEIEYFDVTDHEINLDDDYVDVAMLLCKKVLENKENFGIGICGTGVGMSIACNKIKGVRAGTCFNEYIAKMIKIDNDCNVICFGGRLENNIEDIKLCIDEYMKSNFGAGRHQRRLDKIKDLEEKFGDI